jgi:triphosphoribosyl-dephospho-CoA synthase
MEKVGRATRLACLLEVSAGKPGNVSIYREFRDTSFLDFVLSAEAIAPVMQRAAQQSVGDTVLEAVRATWQVVQTNTNLGIVLLLAPLARASGQGSLRERLRLVLEELTVEDARKTYAAIRMASPGGLKAVNQGDVNDHNGEGMNLREAMFLARERDTIAREYVTSFELTFSLGYPALVEHYRTSGWILEAIVQAYLIILSQVPDTLIARKNGMMTAEKVSRQAREVLAAGGIYTETGKKKIRELDESLRVRGNLLNPGTTADLIVSSLFVALLAGELLELG